MVLVFRLSMSTRRNGGCWSGFAPGCRRGRGYCFQPIGSIPAWRCWSGSYRLRLKGHLRVDIGQSEETTTGALAQGVRERYLTEVGLFACGVQTHLGILHDPGHPQPWIIAMDAPPTCARVLDDAARWSIEPMFSDLKSRGFNLQHSQLQHADRLERLVLIMALAMYGCVRAGRAAALASPTPLEKKSRPNATSSIGPSEKPPAVWLPGLNALCAI